MHPFVETRLPAVVAVCRRAGVKRLEIFGSAARSDFDLERSDIDFLVEFDRAGDVDPLRTYFDLKDELEAVFDRAVDLVESSAVQNPYVRESIDLDRRLVYAA